MKVELSVREWGAHALHTFVPAQVGPGLSSFNTSRGLATDYIASGARVEKAAKAFVRDEIIGVMKH